MRQGKRQHYNTGKCCCEVSKVNKSCKRAEKEAVKRKKQYYKAALQLNMPYKYKKHKQQYYYTYSYYLIQRFYTVHKS